MGLCGRVARHRAEESMEHPWMGRFCVIGLVGFAGLMLHATRT